MNGIHTAAICVGKILGGNGLLLAAILVASLLLVGLLVVFVWFSFHHSSMRREMKHHSGNVLKRRHPPGTIPGQEKAEVTLVQSDIEGSTEMWEW